MPKSLDQSPIAEIVQRRCAEEGLNIREFAAKYRLGKSTTYNLVAGKKTADGRRVYSAPSLELLFKLAPALDMTEGEIVELYRGCY